MSTAGVVRVGVVGSAHWARAVHVPGARSAGAQVAGLWSRTRSSTRAAAAECGVEAVDSFEELLEAVDIVTMAVPPYAQADLAVQAARAGRHLLLDKPLATSLAAAEAVGDAVRSNEVACLVFHTRHFVPEIEAAVAFAAAQEFGHGEIHLHYPVLTDPASPYAANAWRHTDGAAYWELGPHALSSSIPVLGPVTSVRARREEGPERTVAWTTTHAGGAVCDYSLSTSADPSVTPLSRFAFRDPGSPVSGAEAVVLPDPSRPRSATFAHAVKELIDASASGSRPATHGPEQATEIVRVLESAVAAAHTGDVVYLTR